MCDNTLGDSLYDVLYKVERIEDAKHLSLNFRAKDGPSVGLLIVQLDEETKNEYEQCIELSRVLSIVMPFVVYLELNLPVTPLKLFDQCDVLTTLVLSRGKVVLPSLCCLKTLHVGLVDDLTFNGVYPQLTKVEAESEVVLIDREVSRTVIEFVQMFNPGTCLENKIHVCFPNARVTYLH